MSYSLTTRNDVKQLAEKIEMLAKEVQVKLENGDDCLLIANELVRNNTTFVFTLGEIYALEHNGSIKVKTKKPLTVNGKIIKAPAYHNKRDASGRFIAKGKKRK